jgi:hypothetical protein
MLPACCGCFAGMPFKVLWLGMMGVCATVCQLLLEALAALQRQVTASECACSGRFAAAAGPATLWPLGPSASTYLMLQMMLKTVY